jgi:hypothetical protein
MIFVCLFILDASNISAGDLENIIETETPPQSPPASEIGPLLDSECSKLSNNGVKKSSDRRRIHRDANVSQFAMPSSYSDACDNLNSPLSSQPSSPTVISKPNSPMSIRSRSLRLTDREPIATVDSFTQHPQDQVLRVAEYTKRDFSALTDAKIDVSLLFIYKIIYNVVAMVLIEARII